MDTAAFQYPVRCPACGTLVAHLTHLQWGVCPKNDAVYEPGDCVEWLLRADGTVLPSCRLRGLRYNFGDPSCMDLLLKDPTLFGGPLTCPDCHGRFEGRAAELRGGRFVSARLYAYDELPDDVDVFEILADNSLRPLPEWGDAEIFGEDE